MDTALRELQEETGITLGKKDLTTLYIDKYIGTDGNTYTTYIYGAFINNERPQIQLSNEFSGYIWLSLSEQILLSRQMKILYSLLSQKASEVVYNNVSRERENVIQEQT